VRWALFRQDPILQHEYHKNGLHSASNNLLGGIDYHLQGNGETKTKGSTGVCALTRMGSPSVMGGHGELEELGDLAKSPERFKLD
jgi:hypothetical protein